MKHHPTRPLHVWRQAMLLLLTLLAATGCERRDLWVYEGGYATVRLDVDWSQAEEVPTGMTAIFYNRDTTQQPVVVITPDIHSTTVNLRQGTYDVLLFNQIEMEFSNEEFRRMDQFPTSEVALLPLLEQPRSNSALYGPVPTRGETATDASSEASATGAASETSVATYTVRTEVFEEPEPMAEDTLVGLQITRGMVEEQSLIHYEDRHNAQTRHYEQVIHMKPHPIVWTLHVTVQIKGIQNMAAVRGSIVGLAEGRLLGLDVQNRTAVYHSLDDWFVHTSRATATDSMGWIYSTCRTFGMMNLPSFTDDDVILNLQILLRDQTTIREFHYNVANDIRVLKGELLLDLVIDADTHPTDYPQLEEVAPAPDDASGFSAIVEDWDEEEVTIFLKDGRRGPP